MRQLTIIEGAPDDEIAKVAHELLHLRAETRSRALAERLVALYHELGDVATTRFFRVLLDEFGADRETVDAAIEAYRDDPSEANTVALSEVADSERLALFRALNTADGGIEVLLDMRSELRRRRRMYPELAPVERDLRHLLDSWFNRGFLRLEQLDWRTPAHILESLIRYEAVHEIRGWDDLRRRLAPDRRSFGFFHPALPNEPIIFLEVALVKGLTETIHEILDAPPPGAVPADVDTAIFYAITNCQPGLRGISFGSFLIKQVTERLRSELPQLRTFATLSPIPGFAGWLERHHRSLDRNDRHAMETACAQYLVGVRRDGLPLDPVARFHLRNGACIERINFEGDRSDKGMGESHGLLVNYLYSDQDLAANHDALTLDGVVTASPVVLGMVGTSVDDELYRVRGPLRR